MKKAAVLAVFAQYANRFLTPDEVLPQVPAGPDRRSFYSYLQRLAKQRLLERKADCRRGELAYRITERGLARLQYFCRRSAP